MNLRTIATYLLLCAIWSSTWLFIKQGLDDLPPLSFAGLRFVLASGVLLLVNVVRGVPLPRTGRDWQLIAVTGFLTFTVNYGLLFWGERQIDSGLAAVLQASIPAFGLVFAHLHLPGERLTPWKISGVMLGLVGVGIICANEQRLAGPLALWGCGAVVVGAASTSYASVLVKSYGGHLDPSVLAAWQMTCGWVPLLALGWLLEGAPWHFRWTGQAVFDLFYLALMGSSLAFCLMYWLVRRVAVTKTMLIALVTPVAAVILGAVVRGERLSVRSLVGGLCVLLGLVLVIWQRDPKRAAAPAAETLENVKG